MNLNSTPTITTMAQINRIQNTPKQCQLIECYVDDKAADQVTRQAHPRHAKLASILLSW
jgi:hypothetical protein